MIFNKIALYNWENGAFIMTVIFGLVIVAIVVAVYLMMKNDQGKSDI
jgi:ABC-type multidrug transport system permease subunit